MERLHMSVQCRAFAVERRVLRCILFGLLLFCPARQNFTAAGKPAQESVEQSLSEA